MNDFALGWFFVAILVFWFVGAYNRLVRLRSKAIVAFLTLGQLFDHCEEERSGFRSPKIAGKIRVASQRFLGFVAGFIGGG